MSIFLPPIFSYFNLFCQFCACIQWTVFLFTLHHLLLAPSTLLFLSVSPSPTAPHPHSSCAEFMIPMAMSDPERQHPLHPLAFAIFAVLQCSPSPGVGVIDTLLRTEDRTLTYSQKCDQFICHCFNLTLWKGSVSHQDGEKGRPRE